VAREARNARTYPSFAGLVPSTLSATKRAQASSIKSGTRAELALRALLEKEGVMFRVNVRELPGCPDVVLDREKIAVFCDGDFWHGRNLEARLRLLKRGHNGRYWARKILSNVDRDRRVGRALRYRGWSVLRVWETDVLRKPDQTLRKIHRAVELRSDRLAN
jgi:DNA mismatch endonuclease, patch repair protein